MALESVVVQFGEWLPDQAALGVPLTQVRNVIPQGASYSSVPGPEIISDAITSRAFTGFATADDEGDYYLFAGCATKLYALTSGTTWTDVSDTGDYTGIANWEFIKWGERIIAIPDGDDYPQYYDMGTSTDFTNLTNAPKATCGAVVGDFVVLGGGTTTPSKIIWSGFNNSTTWTASSTTQSDSQTLFGAGTVVKRIVPQGNQAVIFCDRSIRLMTYVGPPLVFRFDIVEEDRGVNARWGIAWNGQRIFYYGIDGFYEFSIGQGSKPIGLEKVDRFIRADMDFSRISEMRAAVDRRYQMVVWNYPSLTTGQYRMLCYRWTLERWSIIDANLETVFDYASGPLTIEQLDTLYTNISNFDISVDSSSLQGGAFSLGGFNTDHKLVSLSSVGAPLTAEIETGEMNIQNGKRVSVKSIRPLIDTTSSLYTGVRDNQTDSYTYGPERTVNTNGEFDERTSSRYHRFKLTASTQFKHAQGVEVFFRKEGRR